MKPRENPFRVDRMHSLPFEPVGVTWAELWTRLEQLRFRGAIVGPHGSGKSTLLRAIDDELVRGGRAVVRLSLNDESGGREKHATVRRIEQCADDAAILLDGYEQLSPVQRVRIGLRRRRVGGLLITAHHATLLPTLIHTRTSPALLTSLVARLKPETGGVSPAIIEELWHRHRGNIREALMELYDVCAAETAGQGRS